MKTRGDRWRQNTKHLKKLFQHDDSIDGASPDQEAAVTDEGGVSSTRLQCFKTVQIIDAETHMDGIRPHTIYVIMARREGGGFVSI